MTAVRGWKCLRCRQMQTRHDEVSDPTGDSVFVCADGKVSNGFERFITDPTRRTASFDSARLDLLHYIVTGILAGRDISAATRHPQFGKLASKVTNMRRKSKAAARR